MIKPNELRTGNFVQSKDGEAYQCTAYTILAIERDGLEVFGIPLTEEWLLKYGFEFRPHLQDFFIRFGNYGAILIFTRFSAIPKVCNQNQSPVLLDRVDFVHQLQNLTLCLTTQELTLIQ